MGKARVIGTFALAMMLSTCGTPPTSSSVIKTTERTYAQKQIIAPMRSRAIEGTLRSYSLPNNLQGIQTDAPARALPDRLIRHFKPMPAMRLAEVSRGKGAFVFYSFAPTSPIYWAKMSPQVIVNRAQTAGLKYLEIRLGYSNWLQIAQGSQQEWFNHLLNSAHRHGIRVIGWIIPYVNNQSAQTIQTSLAGDWQVAYYLVHYKTSKGGQLSGLAMDLELGPLYFDGNTTALGEYVKGVRAMVGPGYPLIAIVPDPARTGPTSVIGQSHYYPYNVVAHFSNVLQPMAYWHEYYVHDDFDYTNSYVRNFISQAILTTRQQARVSSIAINLALQFYGNSTVGYPSVQEENNALVSANTDGAIGVAAFQWHTLTAAYWDVLSQFRWKP
ncbi:hypothetical protein [Sulfobacillus thermosulfidooxidans]|uniref:hypothetical protein n=1 Tax=Sulfobacillus thermosulfidooxidans TaxID=28034 RepID=UPI0006B51B34|nr:hypothetical protein [Sulfobacillus thermosulfidooxidans]